MTNTHRITAARALLETVTPLKGDCGKRCAAACCQPDEDGQGGMLLFPGEELLYDHPDWAQVQESGLVAGDYPLHFFVCQGRCPRAERPLSCRIFPLTPVVRDGALAIELDVRAWPVCPLMPHGQQGLSRDFTTAVHAAMALLWEDPTCRDYFTLLTEQLHAFRTL